jgi:hypothetical protein
LRLRTIAILLPLCPIGLTAGFAAAVPAFPAAQTFSIALSAQQQLNFTRPSGGTGDPQASGSVKLSIMPAERQICYDFSLRGVDSPLMAHVHHGRPLHNGPPIVSLFTGPGAPVRGCATANTGQLADMIADPSNYYVTLATTEFPDGALRGQLIG